MHQTPLIDRREALARMLVGLAGMASACKLGSPTEFPPASDGRLHSRPGAQTGFPSPGIYPLLLQGGRDGRFSIPPGLTSGTPAPLIVLLHGASGTGQAIITTLQSYADRAACVLLAPDSRGSTWDAIHGVYADDVSFLDDALRVVFARCDIDPARIGIAGFSDGATYALGIGRLNGDLFQRVVAFSPGMLLPASDAFRPPIYITHGLRDPVLPLELTSRVIIEELSARGYEVTFREFDGEHWIPAAYVPEAFHWLITGELDAVILRRSARLLQQSR